MTVDSHEFTNGGHLRLWIRRSDGSRQPLIHGASPSDHRAIKNLLSIAKRVRREHKAA